MPTTPKFNVGDILHFKYYHGNQTRYTIIGRGWQVNFDRWIYIFDIDGYGDKLKDLYENCLDVELLDRNVCNGFSISEESIIREMRADINSRIEPANNNEDRGGLQYL